MKEAIHDLIVKLKEQGRPETRPASAESLRLAEEAGFPDELITFYRQCEPEHSIVLEQCIWSIEHALVENTDAVPCCALSPHGFIVFASTGCGDSYCIDINVTTPEGHHPVVLFSHEVIHEDTPPAEIRPLRVEVASSLEDFLRKFTNGTLSEEPAYG